MHEAWLCHVSNGKISSASYNGFSADCRDDPNTRLHATSNSLGRHFSNEAFAIFSIMVSLIVRCAHNRSNPGSDTIPKYIIAFGRVVVEVTRTI